MRRVRAVLQQRNETDSNDATTVVYKTVDTISIDVTTVGGREFWEAKRLQPTLTHQVECRFDLRVKPKMRLVFGSIVLNIESAYDPNQRGRRMLLMCAEVVQ